MDSAATHENIVWDSAARELVFAVRGFSPPPKLDVAKSWSRLAGQARKLKALGPHAATARAPMAAVESALARLSSKAPPNSPAELDVEAAMLALSDWTGHYASPDLEAHVVDVWVAAGGLEHALRCVVHAASWSASTLSKGEICSAHRARADVRVDDQIVVLTQRMHGAREGLLRGSLGAWPRLREHLATADEDAYGRAREIAIELHAATEREARLGLAFAFPDERGWAEAFVHEVCSAPDRAEHVRGTLLASVRDAALAVSLVRSMGHTDACRAGRGSTAFESVVLTSLALLGVAAAPAFEALADCKTRSEDERVLAAVLARLGTREAFGILAARVDRGAYAACLGEAVARLPSVGVAVLAPLAVERGSRAALLMGVLEGQARRDAPALRDAVDQLPPALRTRLGGLVAASTPVEEATDEELPAVLLASPWSTPSPRSTAAIPKLATRAIAPRITWQEGEREAWRGTNGEVLTTADFVTWLLGVPRPALVAFLDGDDAERDRARDAFVGRGVYAGTLSRASISVALRALELLPLSEWQPDVGGMKSIAGAHALDALPVLRAWSRADPAAALAALTNIGDLELAAIAIRSLTKKTQRASAEGWLLAQPQYAAAAAIPVALGSGKARDAASDALRFLSERGHRAWVEDEAAALGERVAAAVSDRLAADGASALPSSGPPTMPAFWSPSSFSRPLLKNGRALPLPAIEHLGTLLALGREVSQPHPALASVRDACSPRSLAAFAWDLFHAWNLTGDSAHTWAFFQLGWLGDDDCARALAPMVRDWPGERASARAALGLDVLEAIGSDVALMHLNGIAERVPFPALQEKAREKIERIAEARGLTPAALSDRLVPDLGLDEDGSRTLSFGARSFRVGFDESLRPFVREADGAVRSDLPKPRAAEDAAAAIEAWQALKSDARSIAAQQLARLERAMNEQRRWDLADFQALFVKHPLIGHLTRRLIWGVYVVTPDDPAGRLIQAFRVAEDRSFADAADESLTLDPQSRVGLAHPVELSSTDTAAFGQRLAEYEILQPFAQLARPTYALTSQEAEGTELRRFDGLTLPVERVLGLESRGWRRGTPQKNGVVHWMERALPGLPCLAILPLAPGIASGHVTMFPTQTLRSVSVMDGGVAKALRQIPEVAMSELLRELEPLRG